MQFQHGVNYISDNTGEREMSEGTVTISVEEYNMLRDKSDVIDEEFEWIYSSYECGKTLIRGIKKDKVIETIKSEYEHRIVELKNENKELQELIVQWENAATALEKLVTEYKHAVNNPWYKRLFQ